MVLDRSSVPDIAPLRYRLTVPRPESHLCEVELRFRSGGGPPIRIEMAAWCPGSYLIRDYARFLFPEWAFWPARERWGDPPEGVPDGPAQPLEAIVRMTAVV